MYSVGRRLEQAAEAECGVDPDNGEPENNTPSQPSAIDKSVNSKEILRHSTTESSCTWAARASCRRVASFSFTGSALRVAIHSSFHRQ